MALTGWSTSNYLERNAAVVSAEPFLMSWWGYITGAPVFRTATALGTADSLDNVYIGGKNNSGPRSSAASRDTGISTALTTEDIPLEEWYHGAAAFVNATLREAWLNGTHKGTQTGSRTPSTPDQTRIGIRPNDNEPWEPGGALAEVSYWDLTGLGEQDRDDLVAKLAAGEIPTDIDAESAEPWEGKLVAYWRLLDDEDLDDLSGNGHHMSVVGTLTTAGHPPLAGEGPEAPTLVATPTSWDAIHIDVTAGDIDTTEVRVYRALTGGVTQFDELVATFEPDGEAFDVGLDAASTYFYRAWGISTGGSTPSTEEEVATFTDNAIETFSASADTIVFPLEVPDGVTIKTIKGSVGKVIRALEGLGRAVDFDVVVDDGSEAEIGNETFLDVTARDDIAVPLAPVAEGPQTLSISVTATIEAEP